MNERLYIDVVHWERFQGRRASTGQPWFAVYTDLFDDPDFLALPAPTRYLFFGILCDTKRLGNGRVSADLASLRGRHKVRRASLEPLVQAGFIALVGTRREHERITKGALQDKTGEEEPLKAPSSTVSGKDRLASPRSGSPIPTNQNGKPRKPSATELDEDLRPLGVDDEPRPLRDKRGYLI